MSAQILFDFDNTLLESRRLTAYIKETLVSLGVAQVVVQETFDTFVAEHNGNYDLAEHLHILREQGLPLLNIDDILGPDISSFLSPGCVEVLEELKERGYRLSLITKGIDSFQREKIIRAGLERFFEKIIVVDDKKDATLATFTKGEPVWFVNDNWHETKLLMRQFPQFKYILFVRPDADKFYEIKDVTCLTAYSLQDIISLIAE